jgi:hypothetical protein
LIEPDCSCLSDWQKGVALCHVPTLKERIFGARCDPYFDPYRYLGANGAQAPDTAPAAAGGGGGGAAEFAGRLVLVGKGFARLYETEVLATAPSSGAERRGDTQLKLPGRERSVAQLSIGFFMGGLVAIGSASGAIMVFNISDEGGAGARYGAKGECVHTLRDAHHGAPIHVLCEAEGLQPAAGAPATARTPPLLSCAKDGCVRGWTWDAGARVLVPMSSIPELALGTALPMLRGAGGGARLRALDWSAANGLLVGSHASELLLVKKEPSECRVLVHGHAQRPLVAADGAAAGGGGGGGGGGGRGASEDSDETASMGALRCLAVPLHRSLCVTGGDDAMLRLWSLHEHVLISARRMSSPITALCFDESTVAFVRLCVGYEDGL